MNPTIVNLTPHKLTLVGELGTLEVPVSGHIARIAVTRTALDPVMIDGITLPVSISTMGAIEGLPLPQNGVIFVTSALVADVVRRPDVFSPGELLRDAAGNVIGARGLCAYFKGGAE
jgi:hypothetical protein